MLRFSSISQFSVKVQIMFLNYYSIFLKFQKRFFEVIQNSHWTFTVLISFTEKKFIPR